jgi:uncharacterized membrane protein
VIGMVLVPAALQALVMLVDEGWYHRRRGLGRWERLGHPVDTFSVALAYAWLVTHPVASHGALVVYVALAALSSLLVTKDEPVHARVCTAGEHWLHALLFVLHPVVFVAFGALWWWHPEALRVVHVQLALTLLLMTYQLVYWSGPWPARDP